MKLKILVFKVFMMIIWIVLSILLILYINHLINLMEISLLESPNALFLIIVFSLGTFCAVYLVIQLLMDFLREGTH